MKKILFTIIISFLFMSNCFALEFNINSKNALIYNLNEDTILYEKNKDEKISIASMTKIMTAIVAIENIKDLDQEITLQYADFYGLAEANAAVAGFYAGERVTYRDLLYALMLPSGADAAQALTRNIAGSNEAFVELMNKKAKELNLKNTHFVNPTGLDDVNHYSTLSDVAIMFKYALKNDDFKTIVTTKSYRTSDGYLNLRSTLTSNMNRYGLSMNYIKGGKTGTTYDAGLCLASIANYNGVDYMLITARAPYSKSSPYNFLDAKTIYEYFMNNFSYKNVTSKEDTVLTLNTLYATKDKVSFKATDEVEMYLTNDFKKDDLVYKYEGNDTITTDMKKGTYLGEVGVYYNDELLTTIDIRLNEELEFDLKKFLKAHHEEVSSIIIGGIVIVIVIILVIVLNIKNKKKKKEEQKKEVTQ